MDAAERKRLLKLADFDHPLIPGYSAVSQEQDGKVKTMFQKNDEDVHAVPGTGTFDPVSEIVKRSDRERVESLANRLWQAVESRNPGDMVGVLRLMQAEGWKQGQTLSFEDVKRVAIAQMKKAALEAKPAT